MSPRELNQLMQHAVQLHQSQQWEKAERLYRQALTAFPKHPDILNLIGALCSQCERQDEAISYLQQALEQEPCHPHYLINLGEAQSRSGQLQASAKSFRQAIQAMPQLAVGHYNLANVLKKLGQDQDALKHYEIALQYKPHQAEYLYNYANTLRDLGRLRSAIEAYQAAVKAQPNHAEAHNNLGTVLLEWDHFEEAEQHYKQSLALKPEFEAAWNNLAQFYDSSGRVQDAKAALASILKLKKDEPHLELAKACVFPIIPQSEAEIDVALAELEDCLKGLDPSQLNLNDLIKYSCTPPSIMTYYGRDDKALRQRFAELVMPCIEIVKPAAIANTRPRLGFVVTRGHEGVFIKCMKGLIRNLPERYQPVIVCSKPNGKAILIPEFPQIEFVELESELPQAAQTLAQAQCDLLYYWEIGTDSTNYYLPFFQCAPVQVTSWGWPVTSGNTLLQAFMTCQGLEPESNAQAAYTEPLTLLSRLPIYYYRPPVPEQGERSGFGVSADNTIYFCAQNLRKLQPDFDNLLRGILIQDPRAQIFLVSDKRPSITNLMRQRLNKYLGELSLRVKILDRMPERDYLNLVKAADVLLDSTHYCGGANTNYDAFAAGTPVITLPTKFHRGRFTLAAYQQMGLMECVAKDTEDYITKAVQIANDPTERQRISQLILQKSQALFEDIDAVGVFCEAVDHLLA